MATVSDAGTSLLLTGLLLATVLVGQAIAVRHLSAQEVPSVLRGRVELSNHVRPWLLAVAATMVVAGVVLTLPWL